MSRAANFRRRIAAARAEAARLPPARAFPFGPGAVNAYHCRMCRGFTVTAHRDLGTTPFLIGCRREPCGGTAVSTMYSATGLEPDFEWYAPGLEEYRALSRGTREHVDLGGLLLRPIGADLVHLIRHQRAVARITAKETGHAR